MIGFSELTLLVIVFGGAVVTLVCVMVLGFGLLGLRSRGRSKH